MSPWGRLLDHLADRFGILFLVSAGNILDPLEIPAFNGLLDLERATPGERERAIFEALEQQRSQRTLFSPAEALNVVTVGAWHEDAVATTNGSNLVYAPYEGDPGPNITSALGLGHRKVIKPDIFMPGGRELPWRGRQSPACPPRPVGCERAPARTALRAPRSGAIRTAQGQHRARSGLRPAPRRGGDDMRGEPCASPSLARSH